MWIDAFIPLDGQSKALVNLNKQQILFECFSFFIPQTLLKIKSIFENSNGFKQVELFGKFLTLTWPG